MIRRALEELLVERDAAGTAYLEVVRSGSMSAGLYVLPAGGVDNQFPHSEDEVYVVIRGRARFTAGADTSDAAPGDTIYVAAGVEHRFHDIAEELAIIVVFAPPESRRAADRS